MPRALKARKPDAGQITKPKVLIFGAPGVRKTWEATGFPKCYYIDTEGGASLPAYQQRLIERGSVYLGKDNGSNDFRTVLDELQSLHSVPHDYLTVVIDSFSNLYNLEAAIHEPTVGNMFGADKKQANKPTRQLMMWLEKLDMNVVVICHAKEKWVRNQKSDGGYDLVSEGHTFDGYDKMEYRFDLVLEITKQGAVVKKTRVADTFPDGARFPWSFAEFEKRAGTAIMLRPPKVVQLAEPADVNEIKRLLSIVKMEPDWEEKVFSKAEVASWEEMDQEKVQACIAMLSGRVRAVKPADDAEVA